MLFADDNFFTVLKELGPALSGVVAVFLGIAAMFFYTVYNLIKWSSTTYFGPAYRKHMETVDRLVTSVGRIEKNSCDLPEIRETNATLVEVTSKTHGKLEEWQSDLARKILSEEFATKLVEKIWQKNAEMIRNMHATINKEPQNV